jgi:hypothetical protein
MSALIDRAEAAERDIVAARKEIKYQRNKVLEGSWKNERLLRRYEAAKARAVQLEAALRKIADHVVTYEGWCAEEIARAALDDSDAIMCSISGDFDR